MFPEKGEDTLRSVTGKAQHPKWAQLSSWTWWVRAPTGYTHPCDPIFTDRTAAVLPQWKGYQRSTKTFMHHTCLSVSRSAIAIILVILSALIAGCNEDTQPDKPTIRPWESYKAAAERYIREHHAFDLILKQDFERYASYVITKVEIDASHFKRINRYKRRTWKPLHMFAQTPEGAYLTDQDKVYLERIYEQLNKEDDEAQTVVRARLNALHEAWEPKDYTLRPDALGTDFGSMPDLVRAISETTVEELTAFATEVRNAMRSSALDAAVVFAFFTRTPQYIELYDQNARAIGVAVHDAAEKLATRKLNLRNLEMFYSAEAMYGLEGYTSTYLGRRGIHVAVGDASLAKFRQRLRDALRRAAPPPPS